MMDYENFFNELRECYIAHGLEFRHEWPLRANLMIKNATNCYSLNKKKLKTNKMPKNWNIWTDSKQLRNSSLVPSAHKINNNAPSICNFSFKEDRREVYNIALNLARKIGRLPDNLHSRMLLTADQHPSILAYLDEFGA
jgi:hypothetical protein